MPKPDLYRPPELGPPVPPEAMEWKGKGWQPKKDPDAVRANSAVLGRHRQFYEARKRREEFLVALEEGASIDEACARVGVQKNTYFRWRERFPDFAAKADALRVGERGASRMDYRGDFAAFRMRYLKNPSTWFQLQAVQALDKAEEGEIILLLWPPEHGKTTTLEDFINYRLAVDPNSRITVVSEKQPHAKRILRRVRRRMEFDGPCREYVLRFGPFSPQADDRRRGRVQPWNDQYFDVWKRGESFDERDYSVQAVGLGTTIQGVRADWMIFDDCQGLASLGQTEKYLEIIRQDFLSRPGILGRICFLGTRVGDFDLYQRLMDEGLVDKVILFPAHDGHGEWLWPDRYTEEQYLRLRKRVGESAWFRNYMQRPTAGKESTFDRDTMMTCTNPMRSIVADVPADPDRAGVVPVTVCIDPSLGGANATTALACHRRKLLFLDGRVDHGLARTDQIFDIAEEYIHRYTVRGISQVTELVIESMAFQAGLITDRRAKEIEQRFGIRVVPHQTNRNKHDLDLGVAAMGLSFRRQEFDLPYADKPSRLVVDEFIAECCAWRPQLRGNRLRQDRVVCSWFGWKRWKETGMLRADQMEAWHTDGSPLRVGA